MSKSTQLMDTEEGGESTQYESIKTVDVPTAKDSGSFGDGSTTPAAHEKAERGERVAENIRYGQNISESGQGGMTTTSSGTANDGGYGAVQDQNVAAKSSDAARSAEGYGGSDDMDKTVGG